MTQSSERTGVAPFGGTPTDAVSSAPPVEGVAPAEVARRSSESAQAKARGPGRARVVVRKLGPWSVFKVSLFFYTCIMAVLILAAVILYAILGALGTLAGITRAAEGFGFGKFEIHGSWVLVRLLAVGAVMVVAWSLINVCVVFLYNLISDVIGGIEVTLGERH